MNDAVSTLVTLLGWLNLLLTIGVAVVAFAKLRATPAGLTLGIAFALMSLCGMTSKLYRMVALDPDSFEDYGELADQMVALSWVNTLSSTVLWIVVAVGIALIPLSLRRLAKRAEAAPG